MIVTFTLLHLGPVHVCDWCTVLTRDVRSGALLATPRSCVSLLFLTHSVRAVSMWYSISHTNLDFGASLSSVLSKTLNCFLVWCVLFALFFFLSCCSSSHWYAIVWLSFSLSTHPPTLSPSPFVRAQALGLCESTRYALEDLPGVAMPPPSKRVHEVESCSSASSASAPKRIRGSAADWGRAGFEADPVVNSHCFTWQNASLKEPDEDNERYPWRMPTPVESEPVLTLVSLWRAAMITKYDLMMIEFDRERSKHSLATRMILRDRPQSVKFMLIVTEPPNVSTHEVIKISREFTEVTALSHGAHAPIELVPRQGWLKQMKSNPSKPTREQNVDCRN